MPSMVVVDTSVITMRLGAPRSVVERGTVDEGCSYVRRWSWPCGCDGEIIGGSLIAMRCCERHAARN
jgi:hypothetical protein